MRAVVNIPKISVAISCYNGSAYLKTQVDSILGQSLPVTQVSVVDDGSSDETPQLLQDYTKTDARVRLHRLATNGGVNQGFAHALQLCETADWYALSDQDDFWPSHRIENFFSELHRLGIAEVNGSIPTLLVCQFRSCTGSDIEEAIYSLVDDTLGILKPNINWKRCLLAGNPLYGCCFFFNHALKALIHPIPKGKTTHDYWIALLAAYFGQIHIVPFVGVHYRQHANNASFGAPSKRWLSKLRNLRRSVETDLRSRTDALALVEGLRAKAFSLNATEGDSNIKLLEEARQAYKAGGWSLLKFQARQQAWRPKRMPNLARVLACASEIF